jgi:hypothetical protein
MSVLSWQTPEGTRATPGLGNEEEEEEEKKSTPVLFFFP